jgi:hypothetical protein
MYPAHGVWAAKTGLNSLALSEPKCGRILFCCVAALRESPWVDRSATYGTEYTTPYAAPAALHCDAANPAKIRANQFIIPLLVATKLSS